MWEILGIEPTNDIKAIKTAYARLAKQYNPEEYPEEFKRIHEAYRQAYKYAADIHRKYDSKSESSIENASVSISDREENTEGFDFDFISDEPELSGDYSSDTQVMGTVLNAIRSTLKGKDRNNIGKWERIICSSAFESLIMEHEFRKKSSDLLFCEIFTEEAAKLIANGFGFGSSIKYISFHPDIECSVEITEHILHYIPTDVVSDTFYEGKKLNLFLIIWIIVCIAFTVLILWFYFSVK